MMVSMTPADLQATLDQLLKLPAETECVEFKEAKNNYDSDTLGQYFSALSNEANLKGKAAGWLVFGVQDRPRKVVGSQYRPCRANLDSLKLEVAQHTTGGITFQEIHEVQTQEGRVVMFEIPPAPRGIPVAWKGHFYGRDGDALGALNIHEIEMIRGRVGCQDWPRTDNGEIRRGIDRLSAAEEEILFECAKDGELRILGTDAHGKWVRASKKDFVDLEEPALQARFSEAFESLLSRGYASHEAGLLYRLTGSGFDRARQIAEEPDRRKRHRDCENRRIDFRAAISAMRETILASDNPNLVGAHQQSLPRVREECAKVEGDIWCSSHAAFTAAKKEYCNLTRDDIECRDRSQKPPPPRDAFGNYCPGRTLAWEPPARYELGRERMRSLLDRLLDCAK
jgi:hypothetical protein